MMIKAVRDLKPSASEIREMASAPVKPRIPLSRAVKAWASVRARDKVSAEASQKIKEVTEPAQEIDAEIRRFVMAPITFPFENVSSYFSMQGINYRKGTAIKAVSIEQKLLIQHDFHDGSRGGKQVLLEPTEAAYKLFGLPYPYNNPGFMHACIVGRGGKAKAEQGYKVAYEKNVNGKRIDLVIKLDNVQTACEVAVTPRHELINVRKDIFQAGFQKVVIICKDRKVVAAVEKKLKKAFDSIVLSKVKVCVLAEFIGERQ